MAEPCNPLRSARKDRKRTQGKQGEHHGDTKWVGGHAQSRHLVLQKDGGEGGWRSGGRREGWPVGQEAPGGQSSWRRCKTPN